MLGRHKTAKILFTLGVSMAMSCSQHPFDPTAGDTPIQGAYKTVDSAIIGNDNLPSTTVPQQVNQALLPKLTLQPGTLRAKERTFDIAVSNVDAKEFFMGLVEGTNYNMVVSPDVTGTISLNLKNVTVVSALNAVRDVYGYDYESTPYGFQIVPGGIKTRMYNVDYLSMERSAESETMVSSGSITENYQGSNNSSNGASGTGSSSSGTTQTTNPAAKVKTKSKTNFWQALEVTLGAMVDGKPGRMIVINPEAGIIIAKASTAELEQIGQYLDNLQRNMVRQVIIEAKIIEVTLNDTYQAGIDWTFLGATQNGTQTLTIPDSIVSNDILAKFTQMFSLKASAGSQFSTVIDALTIQGNVQVLSSPRIATLNQQKAVIKVGYDEFFVTNVSANSTVSAGAVDNNNDIELTPFFSGIALDVTPQIDDAGNVILHIHPLVSNVFDNTKNVEISGQANSIPTALSVTRESDSVVEARNGQVVVIGGLMEDKNQEYLASSPFLHNMPFVGAFFRKTTQVSRKTELVILLRPVVVQGPEWKGEINKSRTNLKRIDRGGHFGDLPESFGNLGEYTMMKGDNNVP